MRSPVFKLLMAVGFLAATPTLAHASGYGTAGCGLGSIIMGGGNGFTQVFAATSNASSGSQLFGITTGTSNCGTGGAAPSVQSYIESNRAALANDIARGNGETLTGLVKMIGCKNVSKAGTALQSNYESIFPAQKQVGSAQVEQAIKSSLQGNCG